MLQTFRSFEPSALAVALASLVATGAFYYALLVPSRSSRYAASLSGDTVTVRQSRCMLLTPSALLRIARLLRHPHELPELVLWAALAFGEQPWLRRVLFLIDVLMVSSPALVEDIVKTQQQVFVKTYLMRDITQETAGQAFFSLEGLEWLHQRKIASRFFVPRVYRNVATLTSQHHLVKLVAVLENAYRANSPVDLTRLLYGFTFQAFAEYAQNKIADKAANIAMDALRSVQALAQNAREEITALYPFLASDCEPWAERLLLSHRSPDRAAILED